MDAPDKEAFELLLMAADETHEETARFENRFIVFGSGRLGLRRGELLHFNPEWIDREEKVIRIPFREDCACAYCQSRADELVDDDDDLTVEEALEFYWLPKTDACPRSIYYGWSDRAIEIVEEFVNEVGELNMSAATINRRVDDIAERAGYEDNLYPHAFRASAGLFWADQGLEAHYLQSFMGWKTIQVAVRYIRIAGTQLKHRIVTAMGGPEAVAESDPTGTVQPIPVPDLPDPTEAIKKTMDEQETQQELNDFLGTSTDPEGDISTANS